MRTIIGPNISIFDINEDSSIFEKNVHVNTDGPFYASIASQNELDMGNVDMKQYTNEFRKLVHGKQDTFENMFLVISADNKQEAFVHIEDRGGGGFFPNNITRYGGATNITLITIVVVIVLLLIVNCVL